MGDTLRFMPPWLYLFDSDQPKGVTHDTLLTNRRASPMTPFPGAFTKISRSPETVERRVDPHN